MLLLAPHLLTLETKIPGQASQDEKVLFMYVYVVYDGSVLLKYFQSMFTSQYEHYNGWSPVMAGGLFAVDRKWFWELGGYDAGLEIWGGEQYEISFKVWMCGGEMFDVPCSRVGHIYRKYVPYKVPSGTSLARNLKRVAETWMDEFAEYIYQRRPEYRHLSTGDISAQKELRKRLKCKDFKWFMAAVAWDVPKYYPPVEPLPAAWGEVLHKESRQEQLLAQMAILSRREDPYEVSLVTLIFLEVTGAARSRCV
ncbi:hypothetical protein STEG23_020284 [Scotinomys teguina]